MDNTHSGATLKIQHVRLEATPVVVVAGEIDLSTADQLRSSLEPLSGRVVVDLNGVTFLDSSGIAALIAAGASASSKVAGPCNYAPRKTMSDLFFRSSDWTSG